MRKRHVYLILITVALLFGYLLFYQLEINKQAELNFTKNIVLVYNNDFEKDLIKKAENLPASDGNWRCETEDYYVIPDTVNTEVISYYSDLVDMYKSNYKKGNKSVPSSFFRYRAEVEYIIDDGRYNLKNEKLIKVTLRIGYREGAKYNGYGFDSADRVIIFNDDAEIIDVIGDNTCAYIYVS